MGKFFLYTKKFWMGSKKETREKMDDEWGDETNWQTGRQTKMGEGRDWEQGDKKNFIQRGGGMGGEERDAGMDTYL